jgi:hypothetical protein
LKGQTVGLSADRQPRLAVKIGITPGCRDREFRYAAVKPDVKERALITSLEIRLHVNIADKFKKQGMDLSKVSKIDAKDRRLGQRISRRSHHFL